MTLCVRLLAILTQQMVDEIQAGLLRNLTTMDKLQLKKEAIGQFLQRLNARNEQVRSPFFLALTAVHRRRAPGAARDGVR